MLVARILRSGSICLGATLLSLAGAVAEARIVVLNIDLPVDQVGPGQQVKLGDHHHVRIFFDDAQIDPSTHHVRVLHMQHLAGNEWQPARLDAEAMPMGDAWLDLSHKPYRYHYRSAVLQAGRRTLVDFDEVSGRLTIRDQADGSVMIAAPYSIDPSPAADVDAVAILRPAPVYVMHELEVRLDQVAAGENFKVGDVDRFRLVYDLSAVDPKTHRVKLLNLQHFHFADGKFEPAHPDAVSMPMDDAWLDFAKQPYRLHYRALVTHGKPIIIETSEKTGRLTIYSQTDPRAVLLSGPYLVDARPITGPDADAAATAEITANAADSPLPAAVGELRSGQYVLDPDHGRIVWTVSHHGYSFFSAMLPNNEAALTLDADDLSRSTLSVVVHMDHVVTGVPAEHFDPRIKGDQFFNVAKFPDATFNSTGFTRSGPNRISVDGQLTFLGVSRAETIDATLVRAAVGAFPIAGYRIGVDGHMILKRSEFGLVASPGVGDEVNLAIEAEFVPKQEKQN